MSFDRVAGGVWTLGIIARLRLVETGTAVLLVVSIGVIDAWALYRFFLSIQTVVVTHVP